MGQNASSTRPPTATALPRTSRAGFRSEQNLIPSASGAHPDITEETEIAGDPRSSTDEPSSRLPSGVTVRRQISAQSASALEGAHGEEGDATGQEAVVIEQEERPLMSMRELRMRHAPISDISASPMPRRASVLARLGSRMRPRNPRSLSMATTHDADDAAIDTPPQAEPGSDHTQSSRLEDQPRTRRRLSRFRPLNSSPVDPSDARPRRRLTISRPIPLNVNNDELTIDDTPRQTPTPEPLSNSDPVAVQAVPRTAPRLSRLSRLRRSLSGNWAQLVGNHAYFQADDSDNSAPRRPMRSQHAEETDYLLPPVQLHDVNFSHSDTPNHTPDPSGLSPMTNHASAHLGHRSSWAQRLAERSTITRSEERRRPNLLRGRSSRLIRRDDETPLSHVLQFAAAAIAAQLSGRPDAMANMEALGDDHFDGGLNNLVNQLSSATGAPAPATAPNNSLTVAATLPPLNFWRAFRFVSNSSGRDGSPESSEDENGEGRMVTLVVVGVRSVPSSSITSDGGIESSLDTLMSLPILPGVNQRHPPSPGILRNASGPSRFGHRRGSSLHAPGQSPMHENLSSRTTESSSTSPGTSTPTLQLPHVLADSPPGPSPPPSTPADPGFLSGNTTPHRRPSSASAAQTTSGPFPSEHLPSPIEDGDRDDVPAAPSLLAPPDAPEQPVRQRRRSDSEYARHRDLGAGAARRNGVVEPDDAHGPGRSWLIYVVGTNLQEDHPAFATPSLFTDVRFAPFTTTSLPERHAHEPVD